MSVIQGTSGSIRTLVDGTLRLTIDVEPNQAQEAFRLFGEPNSPVALARLTNEAANAAERTPEAKYGQAAKSLRQSGFFRSPAVWRAVGAEKWLLEWCREQKSVLSGKPAEVAHHVRTAENAGTGIKPEYIVVPLTNEEHAHIHQHGLVSALNQYRPQVLPILPDEQLRKLAQNWFLQAALDTTESWAWAALKEVQLGYEHWNEVPPEVLLAWAQKHEVDRYLPNTYRANTKG